MVYMWYQFTFPTILYRCNWIQLHWQTLKYKTSDGNMTIMKGEPLSSGMWCKRSKIWWVVHRVETIISRYYISKYQNSCKASDVNTQLHIELDVVWVILWQRKVSNTFPNGFTLYKFFKHIKVEKTLVECVENVFSLVYGHWLCFVFACTGVLHHNTGRVTTTTWPGEFCRGICKQGERTNCNPSRSGLTCFQALPLMIYMIKT